MKSVASCLTLLTLTAIVRCTIQQSGHVYLPTTADIQRLKHMAGIPDGFTDRNIWVEHKPQYHAWNTSKPLPKPASVFDEDVLNKIKGHKNASFINTQCFTDVFKVAMDAFVSNEEYALKSMRLLMCICQCLCCSF